ncbi:MAG: response regulator [Hormoscilla sp.]
MMETLKNSGNILVVDDNHKNLQLLVEILSNKGYKARPAKSGEVALRSVASSKPDLILLDIRMPEMDGYAVCEALKAEAETREIPIIFISALTETVDKVKGFDLGCVDFITKPFQAEEVLARVESHLTQRRLQQELEEKNQQLQLLERAIESSANGIIVTDPTRPDNPIIYVNPGFENITGYTAAEAIGKNGRFLCGDKKDQDEFTEVRHAIETGRSCQVVLQNFRKNGKIFWNQLSISPVHDKNGKVTNFVEVITDISDRKEMEVALAKAKEAAEVANRAKSAFLANMSHELRTPLNAILGFTQLLAKDRNITPSQQSNLDIITRSGEYLLTLINQVLDVSKIEAGRMTLNETNFDLYLLLDNIRDLFGLKGQQKGLQLIVDRPEDLPRYVCTDEVKLRQVLINLINNAIKFTDRGGIAVRVRCTGEGMTPKLEFEVEDTGAGIAPEELANLFKPFSQTATGKDSQSGTGLGLAIAHSFLELMGGTIEVSSAVGKGSTFAFNVKVTIVEKATVKITQPWGKIIDIYPKHHYRILIVDNQRDNRQLLIKLLAPLGFDLLEGKDGEEAIAFCRSFVPHLIFMDLRMPVMNGEVACQQIKSQANAPKIIAVTASVLTEEHRSVLSAGFDDLIGKPFRMEEIYTALEKHLGIKYVYEEASPTARSTEATTIKLTPEMMKSFPSEWRSEFHQAVMEGDLEAMFMQIEKIGEHRAIAATLEELAKKFQFKQLLELTSS